MKESLKLADKLETLANETKNPTDWDNARKSIDLAWSIYKQHQHNKKSPESEIDFATRMA